MKLKPKLSLFAVIALAVPVLSILLASSIFIYRSHITDNWRYLERIAALIADDISDTEQQYSESLAALVADEYVNTKLYVHYRYRDYLSDSTMAWDNVPLRDYVANYSLANGIETAAVYENIGNEFKRVIFLGDMTNFPFAIGVDDVLQNQDRVFYDQFLSSLSLNCVSPVFADGEATGLILFQRALDNNYFGNYSIRYDIDIGLVVSNQVIYDSSNGAYRSRIQQMLESRDSRSYFRSGDAVFHVVLQELNFGDDLGGAIATISKGHPIFKGPGAEIFILTFVGIAAIVAAVLLFLLWGSQLIRTIQALFEGTNEVSRGNLSYRLSIDRSDELGTLAGNFNDMVKTLQDDKEVLEQRNNRLRLMNHYIDAVFQSLKVNTLVIDSDYHPVLINQNARDSLGAPSDEDLDTVFSIPLFRSRRSELGAAVEGVVKNGSYLNIPQVRHNETVYSIDLFPIADEDANVSGAIIVMIDITFRETMKQELLKSQQVAAIGQISAALAHELNNPISIILNHVELVQSGKLTDEEEATFLGRIHSEILRINDLIQNLLQFSRNEADSSKPTDIRELITQVFSVFAPLLKNKGIQHEVAGDATHTVIPGNPTLLKQLFLNITKNAIESISRADGSLVASIRNLDGMLRVSIADNGVGMPERIVTRIFDPFYTSKSHPNVGLGLSLCREIARKHGGGIEVSSQEGKGTTVTVSFPFGESQ